MRYIVLLYALIDGDDKSSVGDIESQKGWRGAERNKQLCG
jgi:hypothetical protein